MSQISCFGQIWQIQQDRSAVLADSGPSNDTVQVFETEKAWCKIDDQGFSKLLALYKSCQAASGKHRLSGKWGHARFACFGLPTIGKPQFLFIR